MCREKEPLLHLHFFLQTYAPLKFFLCKSCPLYNFHTVKNIFMKLGTNINLYQSMCKKKNFYSTYFFMELCPFEIFLMKSVSAL